MISRSRMRQRGALRQFTLSTGKSAGRNSSGRITVFHRGGGSKRLQRRIDLKRSTSSMGIVERIEYDPNRSSRIAPVRWIEGVSLRKLNTIEEFAPPPKILEPTTTTIRGLFSFSSLPGKDDQINAALCICFLKSFALLLISQGLGAWAFTWCPLCFLFVDLMDFILSTMDGVPLSFGGNGSGGTSSSKGPLFDLNYPPQTDPEPAPLEPSSEEEESRRERELRASKEYKAVERHNERRDTRIKEIRQRAKEIAQDWGLSPDKCDAVEDAANFVACKAEELDERKQLPFLRRARGSLENRNSQTWRAILDEVKKWRT